MKLHVDLVSAEGQIYSGSATMVFVAAEMGEVGIAPRHAPLLTRMRPGQVRIQEEGQEEQQFFVSGGVLEVQPHLVTVMADTAERAADIDEAAAEKAKQRAEEKVSKAEDKVDIAKAQSELAEAAARLHLVKKLRSTQ
ncbi:ATP synthase F1 subunit epsilon [Salinisphaera dokdonensis CL-ES53]|jgi:F-type H+-transporting ATPase subunit epsilon|uniref:ATP synthase epsilon chain n=1 Tax=Salinisphaera dokdonensis CL-ES53 TaxID=1304272 RepID=A0ABV2AZT7_9GAMM